MDGRDFVNSLPEQPSADRDERIYAAILDGHHPPLHWTKLELEARGHTATVECTTDVLAVGDTRPVRVSLRHPTAQRLADHFEAVLPTARLSDEVWLQARRRLPGCLQTPDSKMATTSRMLDHHDCLEAALAAVGAKHGELGAPLGKDWANTRRLIGRRDRSAEYGVQCPNAPHQAVTPGLKVWQPGPSLAHGAAFTDYMTGKVRLFKRQLVADGTRADIEQVARDPVLCWLVSSEGTMPSLRHPAVPRPGQTAPAEPAADTVRPPMALFTRTLRRGSVGDDVVGWQRICGVTADGFFGPKTKAATKHWQSSRGLQADGIVGPRTRAKALEEIYAGHFVEAPKGTALCEPDIADPAVIRAAHFTWANRTVVHWIVTHCMQAPEKPSTAEAVARWVAGLSGEPPRASFHWALDNDSAVSCVPEEHVAWHAKLANRFGVGYEHAGYHYQTRAEWLDDYSESMLWLSARVAASRTMPRWSLPVQFVGRDALRSAYADYIDKGKPVPDELRGVTTHVEVTHGLGGTHVDPGEHFPMDVYLDMVREAQAGC